ncbi:MAG: transglycosylase domain-containing protein, partial [Oscillospiraceae bacterium]|nr:transglycosylase domain-containing protein [Oscillospiraceae bacterium]
MNNQNNSGNEKWQKSEFFSSGKWIAIRALLHICACTFAICALVFIGYMLSLDSHVDIEVEAMKLNYSSIVYYIDENGNEQEFERLYDSQNRTWVNLEDMPTYLKDAAIAIEDHRFEKHHGVDWTRTLSASMNMFFKFRSDYGASTITQQLVKNLTGDNQDSVKRKLQEIMRALYLERHYDKDTIIEMYLNTIYLGEGCYGVGTAAQAYYGKDVSELTLAECAAMVGITNLPTYYNPYINPENNKTRRVNILNRMQELKMISGEECEKAKNEEIIFNTEKRNETSANVQSYFVDQIIEDLLDDLVEECGYSENVALRTIYSGGLKIYATVDPKIQAAMDNVFEDKNKFPSYSGKTQPECAMILLDPENGDVLGMRGGRGKKTGARILNRATQSKRPPGSSIKPIAVYAPAIEYGLITPFSVEDDAPIRLLNGSAYPKNETRTYSGRTTINEAVKQSINTVSMRTLEKLSVDRSFNFLTANLGVTSLSKKGDMNL